VRYDAPSRLISAVDPGSAEVSAEEITNRTRECRPRTLMPQMAASWPRRGPIDALAPARAWLSGAESPSTGPGACRSGHRPLARHRAGGLADVAGRAPRVPDRFKNRLAAVVNCAVAILGQGRRQRNIRCSPARTQPSEQTGPPPRAAPRRARVRGPWPRSPARISPSSHGRRGPGRARGERRGPLTERAGMLERRAGKLQRGGLWVGRRADVVPVQMYSPRPASHCAPAGGIPARPKPGGAG
jgi:hypothetical protein